MFSMADKLAELPHAQLAKMLADVYERRGSLASEPQTCTETAALVPESAEPTIYRAPNDTRVAAKDETQQPPARCVPESTSPPRSRRTAWTGPSNSVTFQHTPACHLLELWEAQPEEGHRRPAPAPAQRPLRATPPVHRAPPTRRPWRPSGGMPGGVVASARRTTPTLSAAHAVAPVLAPKVRPAPLPTHALGAGLRRSLEGRAQELFKQRGAEVVVLVEMQERRGLSASLSHGRGMYQHYYELVQQTLGDISVRTCRHHTPGATIPTPRLISWPFIVPCHPRRTGPHAPVPRPTSGCRDSALLASSSRELSSRLERAR